MEEGTNRLFGQGIHTHETTTEAIGKQGRGIRNETCRTFKSKLIVMANHPQAPMLFHRTIES